MYLSTSIQSKLAAGLALAATLLLSYSASAATVTFGNHSGLDFYQLYLSSSKSENWGSDRLGDGVLSSGEQITVKIPCGEYDVRIVDEDGDECDVRNKYLCNNEAFAISTEDLLKCQGFLPSASATFVNRSGYTIIALYLSASESSNWGPDQLGDNILSTDEKITLEMPCGNYDLRLEDEDDDVCVVTGNYVCGSSEVVISKTALESCQ